MGNKWVPHPGAAIFDNGDLMSCHACTQIYNRGETPSRPPSLLGYDYTLFIALPTKIPDRCVMLRILYPRKGRFNCTPPFLDFLLEEAGLYFDQNLPRLGDCIILYLRCSNLMIKHAIVLRICLFDALRSSLYIWPTNLLYTCPSQ